MIKFLNYILFTVAVLFGSFGFIIGVIGIFDDTPLKDSIGSLLVGLGIVVGAFCYLKWINQKIKEEKRLSDG